MYKIFKKCLAPSPVLGVVSKIHNNRSILLIYALLILTLLLAYEPLRQNDFVNYDDDKYVTENSNIAAGISRESIIWAFTTPHCEMWHPLTSISHILDCQFFDLNPFWHHLTSFLFHAANTLLLFTILKIMTGSAWPSAFVAMVFALHPMQVESVAWVAERKTVLSSFFWLVTIAAYIRYTRKPGFIRYVPIFLAFVFAVMSKPMVVTLPFTLILLDYWPLRRFQWQHPVHTRIPKASIKFLLAEKIPLFILSAILSIVTYIAQASGGAVQSIQTFPISSRIANVPISYLSYLGKMIYPIRLAVFYPHPGTEIALWKPIVACIILVAFSAIMVFLARRKAYLTFGWLWYLGILVPVIGLIQSGGQAMANRYVYLPIIGISVMLAWTVKEFAAKWQPRNYVLTATTVVLAASMIVCTRTNLRHWQSSYTLCGYALKVTEKNPAMHVNFANALFKRGDTQAAIQHDLVALKLEPNHFGTHNNLASMFFYEGKFREAIYHWNEAIRLNPTEKDVWGNLEIAMAHIEQKQKIINEYKQRLEQNPDDFEASFSLAEELANLNKPEEAVVYYEKTLQLQPAFIIAHRQLALALVELEKPDDALKHFESFLKAQPWNTPVRFQLAQLLEQQQKKDDAIREYRQILKINPNHSEARIKLENIITLEKY